MYPYYINSRLFLYGMLKIEFNLTMQPFKLAIFFHFDFWYTNICTAILSNLYMFHESYFPRSDTSLTQYERPANFFNIMIEINNHTHSFTWDVITHPFPNDGLT